MLQAQIFIDKDEWKGMEPLHQFIMELLMKSGIEGATSFEGYTGFGKNQHLKRPTREYSFDETPMLIIFVDEAEKVKKAIQEIRKHYTGGFIVTYSVDQW